MVGDPGKTAVIHTYPTLLRTTNPHYDWLLEHVLPGLPADYTVFEVFPGRFTVRDARCRCVYFGPGPVEVVRSPAPF